MLLLGVLDWRLAASVAWFEGRRAVDEYEASVDHVYLSVFHSHNHRYLLNCSQVVELGTVDLLLQHELLEVLGSVWLPLQCLKGLHTYTDPDTQSLERIKW